MKTIQNKKITYITKEPDERFFKMIDVINDTDYFKIIVECCSARPEGGFTYDIIRKIDKVRIALENAINEDANIEDAEFDFIKTCVDRNKWPMPDIQFADFIDYIKGIK